MVTYDSIDLENSLNNGNDKFSSDKSINNNGENNKETNKILFK